MVAEKNHLNSSTKFFWINYCATSCIKINQIRLTVNCIFSKTFRSIIRFIRDRVFHLAMDLVKSAQCVDSPLNLLLAELSTNYTGGTVVLPGNFEDILREDIGYTAYDDPG